MAAGAIVHIEQAPFGPQAAREAAEPGDAPEGSAAA
jgi:hypothetical protein